MDLVSLEIVESISSFLIFYFILFYFIFFIYVSFSLAFFKNFPSIYSLAYFLAFHLNFPVFVFPGCDNFLKRGVPVLKRETAGNFSRVAKIFNPCEISQYFSQGL